MPPSVASSFQFLSKSVQTAGWPAVAILGSMPVESGRVSQHQKIGKQPNCKHISFATPCPRIEPPIVRISCLKLDLMSTLMCDFDLILVFSHDKMASSLCLTCQRVGSALGQQKCTKASSFGRSRLPGVLLVMSVAPSYLCCHHFAAKLKLALARELPGPSAPLRSSWQCLPRRRLRV